MGQLRWWISRRADLSILIHLILLLVQSLTNADGVLYVSKGTTTADNASSTCKLAIPAIHFGVYGNIDVNTESLDGADLKIADSESVWSGYVQTYAAFLYEGCFEQNPSNSPVSHTNMPSDPGQCYSICNTPVIGMQSTTCHCIPRPGEARTLASGCNIKCSNPAGTVCGGHNAVSIYRKVQYPEHRDCIDGAENQNCRALFWSYNGEHCYSWRECRKNYGVMCGNGSSSSEIEYYWGSVNWSFSAERCLSNAQKPALEISSGFPDLSVSAHLNNYIWIGQIRSRVIGKDVDGGEPGWRRGVITKAKGKFVLRFSTYQTTMKSLCENVSTSTPGDLRTNSEQNATPDDDPEFPMTSTSAPEEYHNSSEQSARLDDEPQFTMIAVYSAIPAVVVVLVAVVVIVVLCKRRKRNQDDPSLSQENAYSDLGTRNAVTYDSYHGGDDKRDDSTIEPVNEHAVADEEYINMAINTEYDTTTNPNQALSQENDQSGLGTRNDASYESYHGGDDTHDYLTIEPVNQHAVVEEVYINLAING